MHGGVGGVARSLGAQLAGGDDEVGADAQQHHDQAGPAVVWLDALPVWSAVGAWF